MVQLTHWTIQVMNHSLKLGDFSQPFVDLHDNFQTFSKLQHLPYPIVPSHNLGGHGEVAAMVRRSVPAVDI